MYQRNPPFVPPDFLVPSGLETADFRLRMLTIHDAVKDYDAVMGRADRLQELFPHSMWPAGLTLEQNLIDLAWHHKEFQNRFSFTYTLVSPDESRVLGCLYILPTVHTDYDAEVTLWAREEELERRLYPAVRSWLERDWPFSRVAYPGREIGWKAYGAQE